MNTFLVKTVKKSLVVSCFAFSSQYALAQNDCSPQALGAQASIINAVAQASGQCTAQWYSTPAKLFEHNMGEQQLLALNTELSQLIADYRAEPEQIAKISNMVTYLSAAYYVRYGMKSSLGNYPVSLSHAIAANINAFLAKPEAFTASHAAESLLGQVILLADSIKALPLTLTASMPVFSHLSRNNADDGSFIESANNVFRAMFGHVGNNEFYAAVAAHPEVIDQLQALVLDNDWALDTQAGIILSNAAREIGRLLISPHQTTRKQALAALKQILAHYSLNERNAPVWLGAAEMIHYYAHSEEQALGLTDAKARLEQLILPLTYACDGAATVRAQKLTQAQLVQTCDRLNAKENDFHQTMNDGYQPVADDHNSAVEVVVFDTTQDYTSYSAFLFGNPTNNGGIYLEGNPSRQDNVARFVAHRNDYDRDFSILNLEHEYTHYLDGRYDLYGGFNDNLKYGHIVWWLEGFAEYMHYKDNNPVASQVVSQAQPLTLSQVFSTSYNDGQDRIYRWGYFAVRFMMTQHRDDVDALLALSRAGQYQQWAAKVQALGQQYDDEFATWLKSALAKSTSQSAPAAQPAAPQPQAVINALQVGKTIELDGQYGSQQFFYVDVKPKTRKFTLTMSGSGDADLYIKFQSKATYYDFDRSLTHYIAGTSNEQTELPVGDDGFVKAGRYYLSVLGRDNFEHVSLNANEVVEQDKVVEDDRTPLLLTVHDYTSLTVQQARYLVVPLAAGQQKLKLWVKPEHVKGKLTLSVAQGRWPTATDADARVESRDGIIYLEMKAAKAGGYLYMLLSADQPGNDVAVYPYTE